MSLAREGGSQGEGAEHGCDNDRALHVWAWQQARFRGGTVFGSRLSFAGYASNTNRSGLWDLAPELVMLGDPKQMQSVETGIIDQEDASLDLYF
jgi:hypothetical protein